MVRRWCVREGQMAGTLYVVGTPIGNLEDMTFRAVRVLKQVDFIACEDTRQTRKLLNHFEIDRPLVSCHEHNEQARAAEIVDALKSGSSVAVVSDAGTPLVADPGYRVVVAAIEAGIRVEPIPGPSAVLAALSASGLPTDDFRFGGFLPARRSQRLRTLEALRADETTLVFFEAPHRVIEALEDIATVLGPRRMVAAREITKLHEEFLRGPANEIQATLSARGQPKGEFTLVVSRPEAAAPSLEEPVEAAVTRRISEGMGRMDAMKAVARERGISKHAVYEAVERARSGKPGQPPEELE